MGVGETDHVGAMLGDEVFAGNCEGDDVAIGVQVLVAVAVRLGIGATVPIVRCATWVPARGVAVTIEMVTAERLGTSTKKPIKIGMDNKSR